MQILWISTSHLSLVILSFISDIQIVSFVASDTLHVQIRGIRKYCLQMQTKNVWCSWNDVYLQKIEGVWARVVDEIQI